MIDLNTLISLVIFLSVVLSSLFTMVLIIIKKKVYGTVSIIIMSLYIISTRGIFFLSLYGFSFLFYFSPEVNLLLWEISQVAGFITLFLTFIFYTMLKNYGSLKPLSILFIIFFFGLLVGELLIEDSIKIILYDSTLPEFSLVNPFLINYIFCPYLKIIIVSYLSLVVIYSFLIWLMLRVKRYEKGEGTFSLTFNSSLAIVALIALIIYILTSEMIFRQLHFIITAITTIIVNLVIIKQPFIFFKLSNRIYSIKIYHKSGILLYSYDFENNIDIERDSYIWGNILIGLNYIIKEFLKEKKQIEVIQTRNSDLLVKYDTEYGFAVVVITSQKNKLVEILSKKLLDAFRVEFESVLNEIKDLNKIINIKDFLEAKELIEDVFKYYI
ncbi:MAG: hypothetical protein ACTSRH_13190 [Promethearchaeota archaeon]